MGTGGTAMMAKKKAAKEPRRYGTLIRADTEVVDMAKKVAALRGVSMAEYVSETLRPIVKRDLDREARKLARGGEGDD